MLLDRTLYRMTTAQILYHMPDHPSLLQTYIWQDMDSSPTFPVLRKFLDFWARELEGKLHSIQVMTAGMLKPPQWRSPGAFLSLH